MSSIKIAQNDDLYTYSSSHSSSVDEERQKELTAVLMKVSNLEQEREMLVQQLDQAQLELRRTLEDRNSTLSMYEEQFQAVIQERDALVTQYNAETLEQ